MTCACLLLMSLTLPARATGDDLKDTRIRTLLQRIDAYNQSFKDRRYSKVIDIWARKYRQDTQEDLRDFKKMGRLFRPDTWEVKEIHIADDRARVRILIKVRARNATSEKWEDLTTEETDFWVFERDNWYFIPLFLSDWDDSKAVEVPLPQKSQPPPQVNIKVKP